jgi:hypothetical protein
MLCVVLLYVLRGDSMLLRVSAGILFGIWMILLLMGKGGLVHLLLLNALGVAFTEALVVYRTRMTRAY